VFIFSVYLKSVLYIKMTPPIFNFYYCTTPNSYIANITRFTVCKYSGTP